MASDVQLLVSTKVDRQELSDILKGKVLML